MMLVAVQINPGLSIAHPLIEKIDQNVISAVMNSDTIVDSIYDAIKPEALYKFEKKMSTTAFFYF